MYMSVSAQHTPEGICTGRLLRLCLGQTHATQLNLLSLQEQRQHTGELTALLLVTIEWNTVLRGNPTQVQPQHHGWVRLFIGSACAVRAKPLRPEDTIVTRIHMYKSRV